MLLKRFRVWILAVGIGLALTGIVLAESAYNTGVQSKVVLKTTKDVVGQNIVYPQAAHPEVTGSIVRIPAGQETGWHTHSVPGYAYIISGTITMQYEKGFTRQFIPGEAFAEVVNVPHNGRNNGTEEVVLVVFFTGDKDVPFTQKIDVKRNK